MVLGLRSRLVDAGVVVVTESARVYTGVSEVICVRRGRGRLVTKQTEPRVEIRQARRGWAGTRGWTRTCLGTRRGNMTWELELLE